MSSTDDFNSDTDDKNPAEENGTGNISGDAPTNVPSESNVRVLHRNIMPEAHDADDMQPATPPKPPPIPEPITKPQKVYHLRKHTDRYINRELSWLAFNQRVLEEACNEKHPVMERIRFLSIASANLDEFYMVRVAGLKGQVNANVTNQSIDGLTARQQLEAISTRVDSFVNDLQETWIELREKMEKTGIKIVSCKDLKGNEAKWVRERFEHDIFPLLSPIAVDPAHPFPFIPNKGMAIALQLVDKKNKTHLDALIPLTVKIERFMKLPSRDTRFVLLEDVIMQNIEKLFPKPFELKNHGLFRVIRDSELEIEDEAEDLVLTFETALKRRRRGSVIRLKIDKDAEGDVLDFLKEQLHVPEEDIFRVNGLIGLDNVSELIDHAPKNTLFDPFNARFPERIRDFGGNCFDAILEKDIVIHHPYESFDVVVQFLRQAASDPDVLTIKQTLYRTSKDSPIVKALIEAAEAGKSVTALVELKARFDEEANIRWARDMERAGVQVVYGFVDLKTHAKISLINRRENGKVRTYAHFGTGNYHPHTAKVYTDLSYFTCDPALCQDAALMFNYMTGYAQPSGMKKIRTAPINLRSTIMKLVDVEIANAKAGKPAAIWIKCNSVIDEEMIDKFYEASQAGVDIDMIIRGICSIRPGIDGLSENIYVKSIIGRFLEHSRIYCFANGNPMPSSQAKVFISSADLMTRNLDYRIESLVPIENKTVHAQILDQIMVANFKDRKHSWEMNPDGTYDRVEAKDDDFCAHEYFMTNPSLSGRGTALDSAPMPPKLFLEQERQSQ